MLVIIMLRFTCAEKNIKIYLGKHIKVWKYYDHNVVTTHVASSQNEENVINEKIGEEWAKY